MTQQAQQPAFPFQATVNESIKVLRDPPFEPGMRVTIIAGHENGEFVFVQGEKLPLSVDRFNLTHDQLQLVRRRRRGES